MSRAVSTALAEMCGLELLTPSDLPVAAAGIIDGHGLVGAGPLVDRANLDAARLDHHVAADVAADLELHLGVEGLIDGHGERCAALPEELSRY